MDKEQSRKIVKDTFQKAFDKDRFRYFVKNLLNNIDESKAFQIKSKQYVKETFRDYVDSYERLATYTDPENSKIDILIVYLQKDVSLTRARTAQRNFVAQYLKQRGQKDAGLVAFVSPSNDDWRFSLVKMEYKFTEGKSGKIKVEEEFTPAKRWSFLVGSHENSHTAQSRLVPIMMDDSNDPNLAELEEAFNIEKVTKEFFEKYRDLFHRFNETLEKIFEKNKDVAKDFKEKNVSLIDFSKKLLGQIVFLYFLQRKGWFGVPLEKGWGEGDKRFMRTLFEQCLKKKKNYFNDFLEPLFYEALSKERDGDFYSRFNCRIPFLNGGLFDPIRDYDWVNTVINIPNDVFSNGEKTKEGDIGSGILDVFDRYNFTVKEDEPLEKEVAIDPEMLGKVFENLLNIKDRKSKGTYYTPREIVHYMCQQSLLNYLATELDGKVSRKELEKLLKYGEDIVEHETVAQEKMKRETYRGEYKRILPESIEKNAKEIDNCLIDIKVCDPAIGSGAFPVGMMNEIVRVRSILNPYLCEGKSVCKKRTGYDFKFECIQNSLYGVDIDSGAVEIAKLRLWLSLIVDEDDIRSIKPLPNLDYKIMQGNSLLEEYEGIKLFDEKIIEGVENGKELRITDLKRKQSKLQSEYIGLHQKFKLSENKKVGLEKQLKDIAKEIKYLEKDDKNESENGNLFESNREAKLKADLLKKLHKEFFAISDSKNKKKLKKEIEKLEWDLIETTLSEEEKGKNLEEIKDFKEYNVKPWFLWGLNFADVFEKRGGFDVVIGNPPYVGEKGHKEIFRPISKGNLKEFYQRKMDLFYFFFHLALNIGKNDSIIAFITTNYYLTATGGRKLRVDLKNRARIVSIINFNELRIFESALGQHNNITIVQKGNNINFICETCSTKRNGDSTPELLLKILNREDGQTKYDKVLNKDLFDGEECYIRIESSGKFSKKVNSILEKIKLQGDRLINMCNVSQGLLTGVDRVTKKHVKNNLIIDENEVGSGVYIIRKDELLEMNLNNKERSIVYPFYKNSDIGKYYSNKIPHHYVIYATRDLNIKEYKKIYSHLEKYKNLIMARSEDRGEMQAALKIGKWWVVFAARNKNVFLGEKIVVPQRSYENRFALNKRPWFGSADIYFISKRDENISLKYLLALLNSKLYYFWLYYKGKRKGEMLELFYIPLTEIPVKRISTEDQKSFIEIVDQIIKITENVDYDPNTCPKKQIDLEKKLDNMVFDLFGLTKEEREIVLKS